MGLFDFFPCCGPRRKDKLDNDEQLAESSSLLPHRGPASIISQENYGTLADLNEPKGLTGEQRLRIEEIGREANNHMLPIHLTPKPHHSPQKPSLSPSSSSSRPSSPSPLRPETSPPGGTMRSPEPEEGDEQVVQKTVFLGGLGDRGSRKASRGRGRGRG
ncbi:hypothetical protein P7C73_g5064, partial [Tremellales sp. Uapishka_1]